MGLFTSDNAAQQPSPLPQPQGVFPEHTHHNGVAMKVREKKFGLSGDNFSVKDVATDRKLFEVSGKVFSISDKKVISDASGQKLFSLHKKHFTLHNRIEGEDHNGNVLFSVKKALISIGSKFEIEFQNKAGDGSQVSWQVKGDVFDRKATITTQDGQPVAAIARSFANMGQVFFDKQTYVVSVAGNADAALLLAVAVTLDEYENDDDKK